MLSSFFLFLLQFLCLPVFSYEAPAGSAGMPGPRRTRGGFAGGGRRGKGKDGSSREKAFTLSFTGINLDDEIAMKALFQGVEDSYVRLDLSGLTGDTWHCYSFSKQVDKSKILSLTLPAGLTAIADGADNNSGAFAGFTGLESLSAAGVKNVGRYAFYGCTSLTSLSLPSARDIDSFAFYGCTGLASLDLPAAGDIGYAAFDGCTGLVSLKLPAATNIHSEAFYRCTSLTSLSLGAAREIGSSAFSGCTGLAIVSLPAATDIDSSAFYGCTGLANLDLPAAINIDDYAFDGCTGLARLNMGAVTDIGHGAFTNTDGTALTISLGDTPPSVEDRIFGFSPPVKTVTIKAPDIESGNTAYGTAPSNTTIENWGNAFRGMGWNRDTGDYGLGMVKGNITLVYENL
jgi:hypothetical protein